MPTVESSWTAKRPRIQVLQSLRQQTENDNPYLKQVLSAIEPHAEVVFFSWGKALFGDYDVFHVHWPEFLLREEGRSKPVQYFLFLAFLLRMAALRRPIVRTMHNLEPHEGATVIERLLLGMLDRQTRMWIRINATTPRRTPQTVTILHGHYRDWFATKVVPESMPGRLLYFGLIRPYKGVESLLESFCAIEAERAQGLQLRVVGNPATAELAEQIQQICKADPRVGAVLAYVDEVTLAHEIGEAELIVLPFRQMHNSGSVLLALSLDRPVLVPRNTANIALAAEVGVGWVFMYDDELSSDVLLLTLQQVRAELRAPSPDFSLRDWQDAGHRHYSAYLAAMHGLPLEGASL